MVPYGSPEDIGVIQLAWLGDSVWELHQRLRHVHFPLKSKELHLSVVNEVKAKSQSKSLSQIEHLLNPNEMDLIRRARNKSKRSSKSLDPTIYSRATGFETLIRRFIKSIISFGRVTYISRVNIIIGILFILFTIFF